MNQCDGCRRRLPIRNGIHYLINTGFPVQCCTAKDYMPDIEGYRELTPSEVELINSIKSMGEDIAELIEELRKFPEFDQRWLSIGTTHLQQGLMALTRAIARPTNF